MYMHSSHEGEGCKNRGVKRVLSKWSVLCGVVRMTVSKLSAVCVGAIATRSPQQKEHDNMMLQIRRAMERESKEVLMYG